MIVYIAYPTSLTLQSANALQTYTTLRELRALRPDTLAIIPRWGREASRFSELGALHLPRPAIGKLSRLYKSTLLYYLEHTAFAFMTAAVVAAQRQPVEAVYVRQAICAAWWAGVFGPRLGVPVIYEAHDLETRNPSRAKEPWAEGVLHLIDRTALTRATAVTSLTADFQRYVAALGWRDPAEVYVIPDAYDQTLFVPQDRAVCRAALNLPADAPTIAYAGMTFAHRWLEGLLNAAQQLRERFPGLTLLLLGGRDGERAALADHARGLGLAVGKQPDDIAALPPDSVKCLLLPPRPQADVVQWLGAADVLAIPDTVTDLTASPLKLFEYMALGQPLVLPAIPALHEIAPPELVWSFPRRDLRGLTEALAGALQAAPDAAGSAARRAAAAAHTYARRAERILAVASALHHADTALAPVSRTHPA